MANPLSQKEHVSPAPLSELNYMPGTGAILEGLQQLPLDALSGTLAYHTLVLGAIPTKTQLEQRERFVALYANMPLDSNPTLALHVYLDQQVIKLYSNTDSVSLPNARTRAQTVLSGFGRISIEGKPVLTPQQQESMTDAIVLSETAQAEGDLLQEEAAFAGLGIQLILAGYATGEAVTTATHEVTNFYTSLETIQRTSPQHEIFLEIEGDEGIRVTRETVRPTFEKMSQELDLLSEIDHMIPVTRENDQLELAVRSYLIRGTLLSYEQREAIISSNEFPPFVRAMIQLENLTASPVERTVAYLSTFAGELLASEQQVRAADHVMEYEHSQAIFQAAGEIFVRMLEPLGYNTAEGITLLEIDRILRRQELGETINGIDQYQYRGLLQMASEEMRYSRESLLSLFSPEDKQGEDVSTNTPRRAFRIVLQ